jgi:hypothetical protein
VVWFGFPANVSHDENVEERQELLNMKDASEIDGLGIY